MPPLSQSRYFDPRLFAKIANLPLISRLVVEGMIAGRHRSPFRGFSVEFSEYHQYSPGDDIRHVDWKLLARSDKVYVKEFEAETNLKGYLLLDVSGSMGYGSGELTKLQYACYCCAALSYLMTRQQDAVGLVTFDDRIRDFLAPKNHPQHFQDILSVLDGLEPSRETRLSETFHQLSERIRRRGLIVVFSDFLENPQEALRGLVHFRKRKHEVIVFHLIDRDEQAFPFHDMVEFEDMETNQRLVVHTRLMGDRYRRAFQSFAEDLKGRCARHAIDYVALPTDQPVEQALFRYLNKRARLG